MSAQLLSSNALFLHIPKTGGTWVEQALIQAGVLSEAPPTIPGVTYRHCLLTSSFRIYCTNVSPIGKKA